MKNLLTVLLASYLLAMGGVAGDVPSLPDEWKSPAGDVLISPHITGWDAGYATVKHLHGVTRVAIDALPEPFRKAMNFDPIAAREARSRSIEEDIMAAESARQSQILSEERLRREQLALALRDQAFDAKVVIVQATPHWCRGVVSRVVKIENARKVEIPKTMLDRERKFVMERYFTSEEEIVSRNAFLFGIEGAKIGQEWRGALFGGGYYRYMTSAGDLLAAKRFATYPLDDAAELSPLSPQVIESFPGHESISSDVSALNELIEKLTE